MKKGILVVSFGTSYEETRRKCIESIENKIKSEFEGFEVRRAFTSNMIIKKLKERDGIYVDKPMEALERMVEDGFKQIIVQPLHIIPGFEYEKVKKAVALINHKADVEVKLGSPLLNTFENYMETIEALELQFPKTSHGEGILMMGHGTEHFSNACYSQLQRLFDDKRGDVFIANVEGYPELEDILTKVKANYKKMTLMPLMLVAGDHAQNDMAGDDEDSWKSILEAEGVETTCILKGLGENEKVAETFVQRVREMMV